MKIKKKFILFKNKQFLSRQLFLTASILFLMVANSFAQQKNFVDKTLDWSYKIIQGDSSHPHTKYFFPIPFLSYKPETRWILGVSLTQLFRSKNNDSITRPSAIRLNTSYSQNDQFSIRTFGEVYTNRNKFDLNGLVQYTNFVENFWFKGIQSPDVYQTYFFKLVKINFKGSYQLLPNFYCGIQYNLENMFDLKYSSGNINMKNSGELGTQSNGSISSGAGFVIEYDNRNNVFFPTKGQDIELSNCLYNSVFGSGYNFHNITLDARKYIALWKENVLAIQAFANVNSGNVPFRLIGTLGSDSYMRGYYNGRFRDNCAMAFQAELRKTIWGPISIVAFGGFGTVSSDVNGLTSNLKPNYGGGLRIKAVPKEKFNIRIDYGMGIDGASAFYVTMGEAF
jgi:outer membrane protein assembly factor BamA